MSLRILLAEDSAVNQKLAQIALRKLGHGADVVGNGREALEAVRRQVYDLVLMDIEMPELDGLAATQQIRRELPAESQPYVIAMTGNTLEGDRERCLAAGMDDYVGKPIKAEEIAAALARRPSRPESGGREPPATGPPATADSPHAAEVLDPAPLGRLRDMLGRRAAALLPELIETFFRNAAVLQTGAREALARGDAEELRRAAHTLKSNSASFGATALAAHCQDLEDRARTGSLAAAAEPLAQIAAEYHRARAALESVRKEALDQEDRAGRSGSAREAEAAPDRAARHGAILVVDDDPLNRMLLTAGLEEQGYAVETAEDGGQALSRLRSRSFDVVLLDLVMPGLDGYQVLAQMKSDPSLRHIPVIVISALDDLKSVIRCIEVGATDYLPRSFDPVLLRARVNASLASKRLHDLEARQRVTAAEERLRREIAELLHGPVQTRLLLAWLRLGDCRSLLRTNPERAETILDEVRAELETVRERDVRRASHLLHPSIIGVGLVPAVRSLIEHFERSVPIALEVAPALASIDTPIDNPIPEPLRLAAYRVVEEALNNVCRHAQATGIQVSLGFDDQQRIALVVADDGVGFDVAKVRLGLGLGSIGDRVGQFGGSWEVVSAGGRGTRLSVLLPFEPSRPAAPV